MHLPIYDVGMIPFDCAIVFQPVPNRTAVMFFAKTVSQEAILEYCEVKDPVDAYLFG